MARKVTEYYCSNCGRSEPDGERTAPPICCGMPMTLMGSESGVGARGELRKPARPSRAARRVVIVGGGIAGLSIAARVAQAGLPVTLFEAERFGSGASTHNQGWLYSGAWFAPDQPELARMCHEALKQTVQFCPDCLEPNRSMVYLFSNAETDITGWTKAWAACGIPHELVPPAELLQQAPGLAETEVRMAFRLPDRAMRVQVLLEHLAAAAQNAGAELYSGVAVARLLTHGDHVRGVETRDGEEVRAGLVVLAGNASGSRLWPQPSSASGDDAYVRVALKAHLVSVVPELGHQPFCVVDAEGFNHVPHHCVSVLGTQRWLPVPDPLDHRVVEAELERIWQHAQRFFPEFRRSAHQVAEWAGTTIHAYRSGRDPLDKVPPPAVIDHADESPQLEGLLSVFPTRTSLWPQLAEEATKAVLQKLEREPIVVAVPPWGSRQTTVGTLA